MLKSYRVTMRNGFQTIVQLDEDVAARDFPNAVPVKVAPQPIFSDGPRHAAPDTEADTTTKKSTTKK